MLSFFSPLKKGLFVVDIIQFNYLLFLYLISFVIVQSVKSRYLKALSDGYFQEVKRLASKKNIYQTGRRQA